MQGILFMRRLFTRVDLHLGICTIPLNYRQDFELSNMRCRPYFLPFLFPKQDSSYAVALSWLHYSPLAFKLVKYCKCVKNDGRNQR